jgi:drug/metabolite transporter (DMT)-like permease
MNRKKFRYNGLSMRRAKTDDQSQTHAQYRWAIFFAILAAVLYAISMPMSKILLRDVSPMMMAAFLYLGAGVGMLLFGLVRSHINLPDHEERLERKDLPYTVAMVVLDIAAPIFLMFGLKTTAAANASLLNNFEIVATAVIALLLFHEQVSRRLWLAIVLVTLACILLTVDDASSLSFSAGSLLVLSACICWGLENNCTRCISHKDPMEIVTFNGFGSGLGALVIALSVGESFPQWQYLPAVMVLGFVAYGMSIFFYTYAQRTIGAAKTSTFYAVAPFIGMLLSFIILGEKMTVIFIIALFIMLIGTYFATFDKRG